MNEPARALEIYAMHAQTAGFSPIPWAGGRSFGVLELGPGDSVFTAMVAKVMGAERIWLVDAGAFATVDASAYERMASYLQAKGYPAPITCPVDTVSDVLAACNAEYLTDGVASLAQLPDQSVDFCLSNAVLEHIPKQEFSQLAVEMKRTLKQGGVCVHRVDLKDHLGGGLNNLRFSDPTWEGALFSDSGFYTNRIRFSQMLDIFKKTGFRCAVPRKVTWDHLPIPRTALAAEFQSIPDEDLLVSGFDLVLRHKDAS